MKNNVLIHTCCAVCAAGALHRLKEGGSINIACISLYYCNPNIDTEIEYLKRANELQKLREVFGINKIYIEDYNLKLFDSCELCIKDRLKKTAEFAVQNNYNIFSTVLTTSPHKPADYINTVGDAISKKLNITFLNENFKKQNGFLIANTISKHLNIYRQNYCGCARTKQSLL